METGQRKYESGERGSLHFVTRVTLPHTGKTVLEAIRSP